MFEDSFSLDVSKIILNALISSFKTAFRFSEEPQYALKKQPKTIKIKQSKTKQGHTHARTHTRTHTQVHTHARMRARTHTFKR